MHQESRAGNRSCKIHKSQCNTLVNTYPIFKASYTLRIESIDQSNLKPWEEKMPSIYIYPKFYCLPVTFTPSNKGYWPHETWRPSSFELLPHRPLEPAPSKSILLFSDQLQTRTIPFVSLRISLCIVMCFPRPTKSVIIVLTHRAPVNGSWHCCTIFGVPSLAT